jgi:hypothetical protein
MPGALDGERHTDRHETGGGEDQEGDGLRITPATSVSAAMTLARLNVMAVAIGGVNR